MSPESPPPPDFKALRRRVLPPLERFIASDCDLELASVCTEDGFSIGHVNGPAADLDGDRVAALASAVLSLSDASVDALEGGPLRRTVIESATVQWVLLHAMADGRPVVLCVAASQKLSMGQLLFLAGRLAQDLAVA